MTWTELDWKALDRLRDGFLQGVATKAAYWQSEADLASYDFTYGERIGWKWDHVLRELRLRGWAPQSRRIFDWGCGSGIASRRVISFFGAEHFDELTVWDHSPAACDFATDAASRSFPNLAVASATPSLMAGDAAIGLLVISHVFNELPATALSELKALVRRAAEVIWVEPGTHPVSRSLGAIRDELLAEFDVIAPCTHALACPALAPGNERDWCHFFAPPPSEIFAHPEWVKFGQRAGIDLRSLPYCFVAMKRRVSDAASQDEISDTGVEEGLKASALAGAGDLSRVIGRPEHFKPYVRVLNCDATGLNELELLKRTDPALYKQLDRTKAPLVYRWRRDGKRILGGEPLAQSTYDSSPVPSTSADPAAESGSLSP
jgi:SAM-dependent methyltransferase